MTGVLEPLAAHLTFLFAINSTYFNSITIDSIDTIYYKLACLYVIEIIELFIWDCIELSDVFFFFLDFFEVFVS